MDDSYSLAELEAALTGTVYQGLLHLTESTGSTNDNAMQAARQGAPAGSVFLTNEQTAGRGRGDHAWESNAGQGIYVSVVLRPQLAAAQLALLPLAAGLAAAEAIEASTKLRVDLRWPNDLLLGASKTGGILVESHLEGAAVGFAVAGIGINVHQRAFAHDLATPATSLDLEARQAVRRQDVVISLLKSLQREVASLSDPESAKCLLQRVGQRSTWVRGRRVEVHGPQACEGVTAGLDERGFLLVETPQGVVTVQTGGIRMKAG